MQLAHTLPLCPACWQWHQQPSYAWKGQAGLLRQCSCTLLFCLQVLAAISLLQSGNCCFLTGLSVYHLQSICTTITDASLITHGEGSATARALRPGFVPPALVKQMLWQSWQIAGESCDLVCCLKAHSWNQIINWDSWLLLKNNPFLAWERKWKRLQPHLWKAPK